MAGRKRQTIAQFDLMIFPQNIIAVLWDFDKTLIPGYMQTPIFAHYKVDEEQFWRTVEEGKLPEYGNTVENKTTRYLNQILQFVASGRFKGMNNQLLRELGAHIQLFPGVVDCMRALKAIPIKPEFKQYNLRLEHYVISSGLRQMILGSAIHSCLDGVWGCELLEDDNGVLNRIGYVLDDTTKTRAVYEINKGVNINPNISVNGYMAEEERRVPINQMIYVADGPSDVPVFSVVNKGGGWTYGVYDNRPDVSEHAYAQAYKLSHEEQRTKSYGPANYEKDTSTRVWLEHTVLNIAKKIARRQDDKIEQRVGKPPQHY